MRRRRVSFSEYAKTGKGKLPVHVAGVDDAQEAGGDRRWKKDKFMRFQLSKH
jgi:hypothetical protein